jgi:uncharacterized protein (TIGR03435 family)
MRVVAVGIGMFGAAALFAQPAFDVASIKPWTSHEIGGVYTYPGGRVTFRGCTLEYLIQQAFNIQQFQVSGGPAWIRSERYDIDAKPPESSKSSQSMPPYPKAPMNEEQRRMLQSLLVGRFQLQYHRDTRDGPVYLLVKGNKPLKMTDSKDKGEFPWSRVTGEGLVGINESMIDLAWRLSQTLARPVLDQTAISGSFDFHVEYPSGDAPPDVVAETLATVQGLGLKLEPSKGTVETIVIERAEKPSAN